MDKVKDEYFIIGKNTVLEALRAHYPVKSLILDEDIDKKDGIIRNIFSLADRNGIQIYFRDKSWFDRRFKTTNHQGVVAIGGSFVYADINELKIKKDSIFLILDRIQDPHNLGAIIRTAEGAGVKDVFIQKKESCEVTETVMTVSSGAVFHMRIYKVANIIQVIRYLKEKGVWIIGTDVDAKENYFDVEYSHHPFAVVVGNEGEGVRSGILKECDHVVKIPMFGKVNSLNVSVATGIVLFKIIEEKLKNGELQ